MRFVFHGLRIVVATTMRSTVSSPTGLHSCVAVYPFLLVISCWLLLATEARADDASLVRVAPRPSWVTDAPAVAQLSPPSGGTSLVLLEIQSRYKSGAR